VKKTAGLQLGPDTVSSGTLIFSSCKESEYKDMSLNDVTNLAVIPTFVY